MSGLNVAIGLIAILLPVLLIMLLAVIGTEWLFGRDDDDSD